MAIKRGTNKKDKLIGTQGRDTLYGLGGNDTLDARGGNDTLKGGRGNDTIKGGAGNDRLYGEAGDDRLQGGTESDLLNGGAGADWAMYATGATRGVNVFLPDSMGGPKNEDPDRYVSIENIQGTNYADLIYGDDNANVLLGLRGDDTLDGRGGDDTISPGSGVNFVYGRDGIDTIDFSASGGPIELGGPFFDSFNNRIATSGWRDSTYMETVEVIIGSPFGDTIKIWVWDFVDVSGGAGDDYLEEGMELAVHFYGGDGNDIIKNGRVSDGGDGDDTISNIRTGGRLVGGLGEDALEGGPSMDGQQIFVLEYNKGIDTILRFDPGQDVIAVSSSQFGIADLEGTYQVDFLFAALGQPIASQGPYATFIADEQTDRLFFDWDGTGTSYAPLAIAYVPSGLVADYWLDIVIEA